MKIKFFEFIEGQWRIIESKSSPWGDEVKSDNFDEWIQNNPKVRVISSSHYVYDVPSGSKAWLNSPTETTLLIVYDFFSLNSLIDIGPEGY